MGKERHDVGRPDDQGYPMRSILKDGFLYTRNYEPDRTRAGEEVPATWITPTDFDPL